MTVANLFAKHRAGEVSKEKFLYEVRRDAQLPYIINLTSYDDAIKILKQKGVIKEQQDLHLQIDRLNPILVKKAVNMELAKLPMIDAQVYQKTTEKVVKKLQKDPRAYDDVVTANAKEVHKTDEKLKMQQVKGNNLTDKANEMKTPKGVEKKPKANVKASKTENKKGKPKGVKEMKGCKKGHAGIKQMENPGTKETVLESLLSFMFKKKLNEDTHHEFGVGHSVKVPEGVGVVEGLVGDTATIAFENGTKKDYQINALRHFTQNPVEEKTPEIKKHEPTIDEKKDKVIKRVMELLSKKKKMKGEAITAKTTDTSHNQNIYNKINKVPGQARADLKKAYDAGKTIDI
jgi:hypothetical protein